MTVGGEQDAEASDHQRAARPAGEHPPRRAGNGEGSGSQQIVAALAGLAGLVGYVYVMGGLALYLELFRTGVPAGEALDEFPPRRFLVIGLPVALAVGAGFLILLRLESRIAPRLPRWVTGLRPKQRPAQLVAGALLLTGVGIVVAAFAWPAISLRRASITTTAGQCITGAYISTDSGGVNLADGKHHSLRSIPATQVVSLVIGPRRSLERQSITVSTGRCA